MGSKKESKDKTQLLEIKILLRLMGKECARDPRGQAGIWLGITELLLEVNTTWNNHYGGLISQVWTAKQMQLVSAEPGPVTEGADFFIRY